MKSIYYLEQKLYNVESLWVGSKLFDPGCYDWHACAIFCNCLNAILIRSQHISQDSCPLFWFKSLVQQIQELHIASCKQDAKWLVLSRSLSLLKLSYSASYYLLNCYCTWYVVHSFLGLYLIMHRYSIVSLSGTVFSQKRPHREAICMEHVTYGDHIVL